MTASASAARITLAITAVAGQLACASATGFRVGFNGEQTGYRPENTPSIYVLPNSWSMERTVDIRARRMIEGALRQMGYPVTTAEKADVYVLLEAWVDSTELANTAPGIRPQSVTVVTPPGGAPRYVFTPQSLRSFPISMPADLPRLVMLAVDGQQYRTASEAKILWRGDTILSQRGMKLEKAIPYLMVPLITSFGTQSKGVTFMNVSSQQVTEFQ